MAAYGHINPYLVGGWAYPSEKIWLRQLGLFFPTEWDNKIHVPNHQPAMKWIHMIDDVPFCNPTFAHGKKIWRVSYHESSQRGFRETALWNAYDFWDPSHWGNPWPVATCCCNWSHFCPRLAATLAARQPGKWDQTIYPQGRSVTKLWLIINHYYYIFNTMISKTINNFHLRFLGCWRWKTELITPMPNERCCETTVIGFICRRWAALKSGAIDNSEIF